MWFNKVGVLRQDFGTFVKLKSKEDWEGDSKWETLGSEENVKTFLETSEDARPFKAKLYWPVENLK